MKLKVVLAIFLLLFTVACGGGSQAFQPSQPTQPGSPNLAEQWEVLATSGQGQNGLLLEAPFVSTGNNAYGFGQGYGPYQTSGSTLIRSVRVSCALANILSLAVTENNVQFAFSDTDGNQDAAVPSGTGTYSNGTITGAYTQPSPCADAGTFVAHSIPSLAGKSFAGNVSLVGGSSITSLSFTNASASSLSATMIITGGPVAGTFTVGSGSQVGAMFSFSGGPEPTQSGLNIFSGFVVTQQNIAFLPAGGAVGDLALFVGTDVPYCGNGCPGSVEGFIGYLSQQ